MHINTLCTYSINKVGILPGLNLHLLNYKVLTAVIANIKVENLN